MFDLLIVGAGPAAVSCGMVLSSAQGKAYMETKKIGMIAHSKASDLKGAILNNLYGVQANTKGKDLLEQEIENLSKSGKIEQLSPEAITEVVAKDDYYELKTENNAYETKNVVLAIGHSTKIADIKGLEEYATPHTKSLPGVKKTALKNTNLVVRPGLYVAGLTSDCASQAAIAAGTGADVAVQLMTKWNDGAFDHHHDK